MSIELTLTHTGKMYGMQSLSTSCTGNLLCVKNAKIKNSICSKCYSQTMAKRYKSLDAKLERNAAELTQRILPISELPYINTAYFRLEAFGDLHNETQLINYINLVKKNKHVKFALWSKNYKLIIDYFRDNKCPKNLNIIISSMFINKPMSTKPFEAVGLKCKVFTVYDLKYVQENAVDINCGARSCLSCLKCYKTNNTTHISELLKSDAKKERK